VRSTPYARTLARARGIDLGRIAGSGPGGRVVARDLAPRILTVAAPVAAAAALCARLNGALPSGAVPVAPADVVAAAAVRAVRGPVAWTLDGATARWIVAPGMRLAAIAAARAAAAGDGGASAGGGGLVLLRATLAAGGAVLQLAFPPGADAGGGAAADAAAIVARLRETIAWPAALLL
jgi:pyruvate dehydrogenase E2 component (dihydrolipoamide acetyltransferase)